MVCQNPITRGMNVMRQEEEVGDVMPPYISPVLAMLEEHERPEPSLACETCPAVRWYVTGTQLKAYCKEFHAIVWDDHQKPIMICDGREIWLAQMERDLEG